VHQLAEYQGRHREDKEAESARRQKSLSEAPVDITPDNKGAFPWSESKDLGKFENDWSMKPVQIRGLFDHSREFQVAKQYRGEKGVEIITPFFTHLGADGKPRGVLVNRGWVPEDLKNQRLHLQTTAGAIRGVLTRGTPQTKYTKPNTPGVNDYTHFVPYDFAILTQLPNREEASQFVLHQVDFDEERRQLLPTAPSKEELT